MPNSKATSSPTKSIPEHVEQPEEEEDMSRKSRSNSRRSVRAESSKRRDEKTPEEVDSEEEELTVTYSKRLSRRRSKRDDESPNRLREWKEKIDEKRREGRQRINRLTAAFLESDMFLEMVNHAFDECDIDSNGTIDASELYAGVLLLYHNINKVPWGGRKPPPDRELVIKTMKKYDFDDNNYLDREEFLALCQDLCSNIAVDVTKRVVLVLFVFPMLALPLKRFIELFFYYVNLPSVLGFIQMIPDHIFTSAIVAVMVTVLPYIEAQYVHPSHSWEAVTWQETKEIRTFKKQRQKKLESSKVRKFFRERERQDSKKEK